MQTSPRILGRTELQHSPSNMQLPLINRSQLVESCLLKEESFRPVIKTKRYNLLLLHQLKHHYERDQRLGRLPNQKDRIRKLAEQELEHINNSINYFQKRDMRNRKILNSSFINLCEKIKQSNRYWSLEK